MAVVIGLGLWRLSTTPRASGQLPASAYVWQLRHDGAVRAALTERLGAFDHGTVLAAEVRIVAGHVVTQRVDLAEDALRGRPVALAIRVGPKAFAARDPFADELVALAQELVGDARANGIDVTELQLDYDCPSSRLSLYAEFLERLGEDLGVLEPPPILTVTALPTWLSHDEMTAVADAVELYVLQLHSLEQPHHVTDRIALFEPKRARDTIERAGRLGRPFRVSLPSYGYLATFGADGRFIGLVAEAAPRPLPVGAQQRPLMAEAPELARFVRSLHEDRPASLQAVAWYRLPVDGDRLAWRWPTLQRVMKGEPVAAALVIEARPRPDDPLLVELVLRNDGSSDAAMPHALVVSHGSLVAADALAGFSMTRRAPHSMTLEASAPSRLPPGEQRVVAWLRRITTTEEIRADAEG